MENLNQRQKELLNYLVWNQQYTPAAELALQLGKSIRTIYSDLESLSKWLKQKKFMTVKIEKKRQKGIRLIGPNQATKALIASDILQDQTVCLIPEMRQIEIAKRILVDEEIVTYQKLMDHYFVSSTSIKSDFEKIQQQYSVRLLKTKKGTQVAESEESIRKSMFLLAKKLLSVEILESLSNFRERGPSILTRLFERDLVELVFAVIFRLYDEKEYYMPVQYIESVTINLLIFMHRLQNKKHLQAEKSFLFEQIKTIDMYYLANAILEEFSQQLAISYLQSDILVLSQQLISHGMKMNEHNLERTEKITECLDTLIKNMSEILSIDFSKDLDLQKQLSFHFFPMICRLQTGVTINNPLLEEIKQQFALTFRSVWYALSEIETKLQVTFNDNELSFLTVYFQVALEKLDIGKHILIVCPTGIGTSELIINKIKKILPEKDVIETCTMSQLQHNNLDKIDFIISSVELPVLLTQPIVRVSPLVTTGDLKRVLQVYSDTFFELKEAEEQEVTIKVLPDFIEEPFLFTQCHFEDKAACLEYLVSKLEENHAVNGTFRKDVFERETLGTTSIETGVAIPHASPKNVQQSKIVCATLEHEILWDENKVNTVILICISETDRGKIKNILSDIYQLIATKKQVAYYFSGSKREIMQKIKSKGELL